MTSKDLLTGTCCICGRDIGPKDFDARTVVASINPVRMVSTMACDGHFFDGQKQTNDYGINVRKFAAAVATNL